MIEPQRERDRAVRIAYDHARRGDDTAAERWLDAAAMFARPTDRQRKHVRALLTAAGPALVPGQLTISHAIARAHRAQAIARGYRPAEQRYG